MRHRTFVGALLTVLPVTGTAAAATVGGGFSYAGLALSSTFNSMTSCRIQVSWEDQARTTVYEIAAADTYQIPEDLPPGKYRFFFYLSPRSVQGGDTRRSGDLYGFAGPLTVPDQTVHTVDVDLQYVVHATSPLDSLDIWPGSGRDCPYGAPQPTTFTLAWEAVPRAVDYDVQILRFSCTGSYTSDHILTSGTSTEVSQLLGQGEEYLSISVLAHDDRGWNISTSPFVQHADGIGRTAFTFTTGQQSRVLHTAGQIVPQVAHAPGYGTSFWTSSLILANPTANDVSTYLYFTPRDVDGLTDFMTAQVTVPADSCRVIDDVVATSFGTSGAGALEVLSPHLLVASRTSTAAASGGDYGQGLIPISESQVLQGVDQKSRAGGVMRGGAARSNLALNEVWGESATVTVRLLDRDGAVLGSRNVSLLPYSSHQISDLVSTLASLSSLSEAQVEVVFVGGTGHVAATLFLVDASDDPVTIPLFRVL